MRLVLWRHGRTAHNLSGRFQGQLDTPLDELGVRQADEAAQVLARLGPDRIVASDLTRAADTAAALAAVTGLPVEHDPALRETDVGAWQGLTREQIADRWPEDMAAWLRGEDVVHGGGESRGQAGRRTYEAILRHVAAVGDGVLVVTSHGGALRGAMLHLLGLPIEHWGTFGGLGNARWAELVPRGDRWRLLEYNAGVTSARAGDEG